MIAFEEHSTIGDAGNSPSVANSLLAVPMNPKRSYLPEGAEISYSQAGAVIDHSNHSYQSAGYGTGHRVGLLLESPPSTCCTNWQ